MRSIYQVQKGKGKMTLEIIHISDSPIKEESNSSYVINNCVKPKNPFGNVKPMPSLMFKFIYGRNKKKENHFAHQLDKKTSFNSLDLLIQD